MREAGCDSLNSIAPINYGKTILKTF